MKYPQTRKCIDRITPYVPGKPIEEVQRELGISDVIKLASNENPLGPSPLAVQAMVDAAANMALYPDGAALALKEKLAAHLNVPVESLVVGNGSDEILKLIAEAFVDSEDSGIYADPSFSEYAYVLRLMGAREVAVPLVDFTHDLEAMAQAMDETTKIVFVCNPNNPTGTIVDEASLRAFVDRIPEDVLVVIDEAYYEYVDDPSYPQTVPWVLERPNVVVTRTFSKVYALAGLRVGYAVANPKLAADINRVKEPFNVNSMAQVAAIAALADQAHVQKSVEVNRQGKEYLYAEFEKLGLAYVPTQTNFIYVDLGRPSADVYQALLRQGVIVRQGDPFGQPTFIRVTIGTPEQNQRFVEALRTLF